MRMTHRLTAMLISAAVVFSVAPAATADAATHRPATRAVATQSVDPSDHTGQIRVTYGAGVYVNAWGQEWRTLGAALVLIVGGAASAGCVMNGIPSAWAPVLRLVCTTIGLGNLNKLLKWIEQTYRNQRFGNGCYQIKVVPMGNHFKSVKARGNCYR